MVSPKDRFAPTSDFTFHLGLTRLGWQLMGLYAAAWASLGLISWWLEGRALRPALNFGGLPSRSDVPIWEYLVLHPPGRSMLPGDPGLGFEAWQVLTAPLVYPPAAFGSLVMAFIGFAFVGATVERILGPRRFLTLWAVSCLGASLGGVLLGPLVRPPFPHFGFGPAVLAILVVLCSMTPWKTLRFFLVVPIPMRWLALGVVGYIVIQALAMTSPLGEGPASGGYELGGVLAGWLWFNYGEDFRRRLKRRLKSGRLMKVVVDDALDGKGDGPVFH